MAFLRCPEVGREGQVSAHRLGMTGDTCGHEGSKRLLEGTWPVPTGDTSCAFSHLLTTRPGGHDLLECLTTACEAIRQCVCLGDSLFGHTLITGPVPTICSSGYGHVGKLGWLQKWNVSFLDEKHLPLGVSRLRP